MARDTALSKSGLLYHFPSKEALVSGLCDRLDGLITIDLEAMSTAPGGAARYYVASSVFNNSELDRCLTAVSRLHDAKLPRAQESLQRASQQWLQLLEDQIDDPSIALAVKLLGDGLYYQAVFADWDPDSSYLPEASGLLEVVDELVRSARR